jgi:hypothetical protein
MDWASIWAIFSQANLFSLSAGNNCDSRASQKKEKGGRRHSSALSPPVRPEMYRNVFEMCQNVSKGIEMFLRCVKMYRKVSKCF